MEDMTFEMSPDLPITDRDGWGRRPGWRAGHTPECGDREVETCPENCEELLLLGE